MGKLETIQLEKYCKAVLKLEVSLYTLNQARDSTHESLKKCKPKKPILNLPAMPSVSMPIRPVEPIHPKLREFRPQFIVVILFIFAALTIVTFSSISEYYEMLTPAILSLICTIIFLFVLILTPISNKKYNEQALLEYNEKYVIFKKELQKYDSSCTKKGITAERNYQMKINKLKELHEQETSNYEAQFQVFQTLEKEAKQLSRTSTKTTQQLQKLYDQNIIFPKYRNFVAMAAITEYIESGRCNQLEGMGGAYNLFEEEIRLNLIIIQLNKVVESLDQIKNSQYLLYTQLSAANAILFNISRDVQSTLEEVKDIKADSEKNLTFSAITAYCSRVTAENTALIGRLAIVDFFKD